MRFIQVVYLLVFSLLSISVRAQSNQIKVMGHPDGLPLAAAKIVLTGSGEPRGFITDEEGLAEWEGDSKGTLTVSFPGFQTQILHLSNGPSTRTVWLWLEDYTLSEIVITDDLVASSSANAMNHVRIIDKERIEAQGANNLRDLLSQELNVRIAQDQILGSSLSLGGISGQNVKILVNGVPVIGRQNGNLDLSQINLENIKRVEIMEGPGSVLYGSNALGGVINLITEDERPEGWNFRSDNYYESVGQSNFDGGIGYQSGNHGIEVNAGRNFFGGYSPPEADTSRFKQWKPKEQLFAGLNYQYQKPERPFQIAFSGNYFHELITHRGLPRSPYYETAFDDTYKTYRIDHSLIFSGKLTKRLQFQTTTAYNFYRRVKNTFFRDLTTLDAEIAGEQDSINFDQVMLRTFMSQSKDTTKLNFQTGFDGALERGKGGRLLDNAQYQADLALFGNLNWKIHPKFKTRLGLRYGYNSQYKTPLTPSLGIWAALSKSLKLRASLARGFRAPSLKEQYFQFVDINHNIQGNPDLKAEYSYFAKANLDFRKLIGDHFFKADADVFYNQMTNLISLVQIDSSSTRYSYQNISKFTSLGIGARVEWKFKTLTLAAGARYTGRSNQFEVESRGTPDFFYAPEASLQFSWKETFTGITLAGFYKYTGRLPGVSLVEDELVPTEIAAYNTADMSLARSFFQGKVRLVIGAKNLFDVIQINSTSQSGGVHSGGASQIPISWGRTWFTSLNLNF